MSLPSARLDSMRVGDLFIDRTELRVWRITGWHKNRVGDCPLAQLLSTGETSMFAGCAEPYGPFRTEDEARSARRQLVDVPHELTCPACCEEVTPAGHYEQGQRFWCRECGAHVFFDVDSVDDSGLGAARLLRARNET